MNSALHDAYARDYDRQVSEYRCYIAEVLFGLCYTAVQPGQTVLDPGIGSGLSAALFAKAGLVIYGFDFSTAMLEICAAKGFAAGLKNHDIQKIPWPYPLESFDHVVCCGVLHFIPDLEGVFGEAERVLRAGGLFAFTTRVPPIPLAPEQKYLQEISGEFEIFSHSSEYLERILTGHSFSLLKTQKCLVGSDMFQSWVTYRKF